MIGKNISVVVFEPTAEFENLSNNGTFDETNSATVNAAISYSDQLVVEAPGKISFTYQPKGPKGKYFVRLGGDKIYESELLSFEYVSDDEAQAIVNDLKSNPTNANIANVFVKNSNPNVYTEYQMLSLDQTEMYDDFDAADASVKNNIYTYISARMSTVSTPADFSVLFEKAVYVELLNSKTGTELLNFIDANKTYSGIAVAKAYATIRDNSDYFTQNVQTKFLESLAATELSGMEIAETNTEIGDVLLMAAISYCDSGGVLDSIITDFETEITAAGGNVAGYKTNDAKLTYARNLHEARPYENLAAFATALNGYVGAPGTPPASTPEGPTVSVEQPSIPSVNGTVGGGVSTTTRPADTSGVLAGTAGNTAPAPIANMFSDLAGFEWAQQAITTLKSKNIVNGKTATEFAPSDVVLREEFAKMVMLAVLSDKVEAAGAESDFTDVDYAAWYAPYIAAATKNNIINGYGDIFGIGDTIRREDMAVMCYRALKAKGHTFEKVKEAHSFTDALYEAGLINGYSETEFNGNGTATRAEAAMILYNIIK